MMSNRPLVQDFRTLCDGLRTLLAATPIPALAALRDDALLQDRLVFGQHGGMDRCAEAVAQHWIGTIILPLACLDNPLARAWQPFLLHLPADFEPLRRLDPYIHSLAEQIATAPPSQLLSCLADFYTHFYPSSSPAMSPVLSADQLDFLFRWADDMLQTHLGRSLYLRDTQLFDLSGETATHTWQGGQQPTVHGSTPLLLYHYIYSMPTPSLRPVWTWANVLECGDAGQRIGSPTALFDETLWANTSQLDQQNNTSFHLFWGDLCRPLLPEQWAHKSALAHNDLRLRQTFMSERHPATNKTKMSYTATRFFRWVLDRMAAQQHSNLCLLRTPRHLLEHPHWGGFRACLSAELSRLAVLDLGHSIAWMGLRQPTHNA